MPGDYHLPVATPNEITTAVVQRLELKLTAEESRRLSVLPTENSEAYQLYLKGQASGELQSPDGLQKSIELYRQAIESAGAEAPAVVWESHARLAGVYSRTGDSARARQEFAATLRFIDQNVNRIARALFPAYTGSGIDNARRAGPRL